MSETPCQSCRRSKPAKAMVECGLCQEPVCKDCATFLDSATFSFYASVPEELRHTYYCAACQATVLAPALEKYQEILERARGVYFFFNTQRRRIPILKRAREAVRVESCQDRDETILRLGFKAAEEGYNAVIEAEVLSEKVRNEGYQKSVWRGSGVPANADSAKLERLGDEMSFEGSGV